MNGPGPERCRRTRPRCICPSCRKDNPGTECRCCQVAERGKERDGRNCTVLECPGFEKEN